MYFSRTFQVGGLIQAFRHARHTRHIHDHIVADRLPDHGDHQAVDHQLLVAEPEDRRLVAAPENTDDTVEKSAVGIVDRREDRRDDDYGQDIRDIEYNAEEILSFDLFAGEDCREYQGERHRHDRHTDDQQDCVLERTEEIGVLHQDLEIVESDKLFVVGVATPFVQRHFKDVESGNHHKDNKQYDCRCYTYGYENGSFFAFFHIHTSVGQCTRAPEIICQQELAGARRISLFD